MAKSLIEIRWHGRGGQGAVTASKILAESAILEGKYIQAFPEFGPERAGAPVRSFTRISTEPIYRHCAVTNPTYVAVLDPTLLAIIDVTEGLEDGAKVVINTNLPGPEVKKQLKKQDVDIYTIDATAIAISKLGRNIPNTPMLGALVKVTGIIKLDSLLDNFKEKYAKKFKAEVFRGNLEAIQIAYNDVRKV